MLQAAAVVARLHRHVAGLRAENLHLDFEWCTLYIRTCSCTYLQNGLLSCMFCTYRVKGQKGWWLLGLKGLFLGSKSAYARGKVLEGQARCAPKMICRDSCFLDLALLKFTIMGLLERGI